MAEILMLDSTRWVEKLVTEGYGERVARGRYATLATIQGYIRHLKDDRRENSNSASANRKRDAQTRQIEIANARADGELGEFSEMSAVFDEAVGGLRSEMMGIGAAVTRDQEMRQKIEDAIDERFARTAKNFAKAMEVLVSRGEVVDADTEADA